MWLAWRYPFSSAWVRECLNIERIRRYNSLSNTGAIKHSSEIPESEIVNWHPQRTCAPRYYEGQYYAGDLPLSAELFLIHKNSSGRMTVAEAARHCQLDIRDFLAKAKELEKKLALGFCKY